MKIVKEIMYIIIIEDCGKTIKKSALYNSHLSNGGAFEGVMTSCVKIIISKRVKYVHNLDNA